jgi:hypothetical protein
LGINSSAQRRVFGLGVSSALDTRTPCAEHRGVGETSGATHEPEPAGHAPPARHRSGDKLAEAGPSSRAPDEETTEHIRVFDAALQTRERIADDRERIADERDTRADERDRIADRRDQVADARQARQDAMEELLFERERRLDERARVLHEGAPDTLLLQEETIDRIRGALARGEDMLRRSEAALDRSRKTLERDAAAVAREVQATEVRRLSPVRYSRPATP